MIEVRFERPLGGVAGVLSTLSKSSDLQAWTPVEGAINALGNGREEVIYQTTGENVEFFRVEVAQQ